MVKQSIRRLVYIQGVHKNVPFSPPDRKTKGNFFCGHSVGEFITLDQSEANILCPRGLLLVESDRKQRNRHISHFEGSVHDIKYHNHNAIN